MRPSWQKDNRILFGIAVALGVVLSMLYAVLSRTSAVPPTVTTNRILLFALFYIVTILILALLFVLGRSAIKLLLESRKGVFGSRFRVRVVVTHVGLAFLPIAVLLVPISGLIQRSADYWFEPPVVETIRAGKTVAEIVRERNARHERQTAAKLGPQLLTASDDVFRIHLLSEAREFSGLDFIEWRPDPASGLVPVAVSTSRWPVREVGGPEESWISEARERGAIRRIESLSNGAQAGLTVAAIPGGILILGSYEPPEEASAIRDLTRSTTAYAQLRAERASLQAIQILLFLLIALIVLLAAVWAGLVLSRRVTRPIAALATSVRRVGSGDFSATVEVEGADEIASLSNAFNAMTRELGISRQKLERANAEMAESNRRLEEARQGIAEVLAHIDAGVLVFGGARMGDCPNPPQQCHPEDAQLFGANQAAHRILETVPAEGVRLGDVLAGEEFQPLREFLFRAFSPGGPRETTLSIVVPKSRESRFVEVRVARILGELQPGTWVVTLEDMTALVRAERAAAWEEAARRMAHEIKNPLTPIRLAAERMARRTRAANRSAGIPPEILKAIEEGCSTIIEEVGTLAGLVDAFGRFARLPAADLMPSDIGAVVQQVVKLYAGTKAGVSITAEIEDPLPLVRADAEQIKRALINLVDNAVAASPAGGNVRITAAVHDGNARLSVQDDGPGIDEADRQRIFDPAFSTKARGTGLGLAITARIAAEHSGRVRVEENSPRGSRFLLEWPAA